MILRTDAFHTGIRRGPLSISFSPNQRNATFHDATLNTTITILHSGGLNLSDHGGTRTVLDPKFAPELHRLGVHPSAQSGGRRADGGRGGGERIGARICALSAEPCDERFGLSFTSISHGASPSSRTRSNP
mgnify:CR=1 FL=1